MGVMKGLLLAGARERGCAALRTAKPKQFLPLLSEKSLLAKLRARLPLTERFFVATTENTPNLVFRS